ncbi:hypothetical protein Sru01_68230 [Sphaerisporangium rufum]|uniref:HTH-like domain-containing protein n=1 Tax=Sphaerisporangium rufum TaxID=1381558 RepID=A0A919RBA5_9ACTN|nr:hypothetical protein Sru01_68230 [Sphaerisporangium rufum]
MIDGMRVPIPAPEAGYGPEVSSYHGGVAGRPVARCTVARLMKAAGLKGVSRSATPGTTRPGKAAEMRPDLVKRAFNAAAPNRLWVADIT